MRIFWGILGVILFATASAAQPPQLVKPEGEISIAIGQTKTFRFEVPFKTINVASEGVVRATARSDAVMTLAGLAEGETDLFVYDKEDRPLYTARVTVTTEPGHVVRIYGDGKDYLGFYCTDHSCGRADKELSGTRDPGPSSVTITKGIPGGSISKTYGR